MTGSQIVQLIVFVLLFAAVAVMGFLASRWRAADLNHLDEWGLGGRRFGSWVTWFLLGGDLYTAYTFVAIPALLFSSGALGFYAVPYTIIAFPLVMLPLLRMWSVSRVHGYVTPADFVRGRYDSPVLALLIAITGIVATMPYIALQLAGLEAVLRTIGLNGSGFWGHAPLFVAFVVLAAYTYQSGLRAPALIAVVKDVLIYIVIIVAVIYLPLKLGGWGSIFDAGAAKLSQPSPSTGQAAGSTMLTANNQLQYATLALGSALALFLYPHSITGVLSSQSRATIRRNGRAAGLLVPPRAAGPARLRRHRGRDEADHQRVHRPAGLQHGGPGAVRRPVPVVVRGRRVRRDRDRRPGARGDHVDRGGQSVDPQHLQGVPAPGRQQRRRGPPGEAGVAGGQGRCRAVHRGRRPAVLGRRRS